MLHPIVGSPILSRCAYTLLGGLLFILSGCDDELQKIRFDERSPFERILVIDRGDKRYLRFGKAATGNQSTISLSDPNAVPAEYIRIAMLGMVMTPPQERVLMIGLGGGTFTTLLRRHYPNLRIDVVEIDPMVVEVAKTFFGVREDERYRVYVADGAKYVRQTKRRYELVLIDAYGGEGIPEDLSSPVFFNAVKSRLSPKGVAILNLWDQRGREALMADRFRNSFSESAWIRSEDGYNLVVFAMTAAMPDQADLVRAARGLTAQLDLSFDLAEIAERLSFDIGGSASQD